MREWTQRHIEELIDQRAGQIGGGWLQVLTLAPRRCALGIRVREGHGVVGDPLEMFYGGLISEGWTIAGGFYIAPANVSGATLKVGDVYEQVGGRAKITVKTTTARGSYEITNQPAAEAAKVSNRGFLFRGNNQGYETLRYCEVSDPDGVFNNNWAPGPLEYQFTLVSTA